MRNKFHNIKTFVGDELLDSRKEARRYATLQILERCGEISKLQRQVRFLLQESYTNNQGKHIRPILYIADFVYFDKSKNMWVVEDVKSSATRTETYKVKKKLFEFKYRDYFFTEI